MPPVPCATVNDPDSSPNHRPLPAAFTIEGAMEYSGFTRSRLYELIGSGDLDARKAGRRTLIVGESLRAKVAALPRAIIRMGKKAA